MYVAEAIPTAANAQPIRVAAGTASRAHHVGTAPEYTRPRSSAQVISPIATSRGPSGVASTESYSLAYLRLKNTLVVESKMAPFIADAASRAGAPKTRYGTARPPPKSASPTMEPIPTPIAYRKNTGSKKPDTMIDHVRRNDRKLRSTSIRAIPAPAGNGSARATRPASVGRAGGVVVVVTQSTS